MSKRTGTGGLLQRWPAVMSPALGTPGLALVRGEGAVLVDEAGKPYLDLLGGIAVNALGHAHPAVIAAVTRQIATLGHVSNLFAAEPPVRLAERLLALAGGGTGTAAGGSGTGQAANGSSGANDASDRSDPSDAHGPGGSDTSDGPGGSDGPVDTGGSDGPAGSGGSGAFDGRVFFTNSGAEAIEAAFKLSRCTGRTHVVAADNAFHGRTMGALALTGQPAKADPFRPLPGDVTHVPYGDPAALAAAVTGATAMVILEPIQGEAGVVVPPAGYLAAAREITARHGALLVLDEIQTGIGRTGHWYAFQAEGVLPDAITLAKGLGGGLPIGALVTFGAAAGLLGPGLHASTFGGNPVCCAAALAVLDTIVTDGLLDHVKRLGERMRHGIDAIGHPLVAGVRGAGLLLGVVLRAPVAGQLAAALAAASAAAAPQLPAGAGFLVNPVRPDVIRLAPPLVITAEQVDAFLAALPAALESAAAAADPEGGAA